jgi:hypothetical protein
MTIGTTITCGLGILILFPYFYNVIFAAYDDILGPEESDDEVETIEEISLS